MAKWIFTRGSGRWEYPTLGFSAIAGDVIEAAAAIDPWWDLTDPGATVTIPVVPGAGMVETLDGAILTYDAERNEGQYQTLEELGLDEATLSATIAEQIAAPAAPFVDGVQEYGWSSPQSAQARGRLLIGAVSATGAVKVLEQRDTGTRVEHQVGTVATPDDHCSPAVSAFEGGPTIVAWTQHSSSYDKVYYVVSGGDGDLAGRSGVQEITAVSGVSYAHLIRESAFIVWLMYRTPNTWSIVKGTVSGRTISWGTTRTLVTLASNQIYVAVNPCRVGGSAGFVFAVAGNPLVASAPDIRQVYYGTVNFSTGAIKNAAGSTLANLDGTSLPLAPSALTLVYDPGASCRGRLSAVKGGDDATPGVFVAGWQSSDISGTRRYLLAELATKLNLDVTSAPATDNAAVSTPYAAGMNGTVHTWEWFGKLDALTSGAVLMQRRIASGNQRSWHISYSTNGGAHIRFQVYPLGSTSGVITAVHSTGTIESGVVLGLRLTYDAASGQSQLWRSNDMGLTWRPATTINSTPTAPFAGTSAALQVAGELFTGDVYRAKWTVDGVVMANVDFTKAPWVAGDDTGDNHVDAAGRTWTLTASGIITSGTVTAFTDFGDPGVRIGYSAEAQYVGMGAFATPGADGLVHICREASGTWTLERWSDRSGTWTCEVIDTESAGVMLARPLAVAGFGPHDVSYSAFSYYSGTYEDFAGDTRFR